MMTSQNSKRLRVHGSDDEKAQTNLPATKISNPRNPLLSDPYYSLICPFLTSIDIISRLSLLSRWNYHYFTNSIENKNINKGKNVMNQILSNEFGSMYYFTKYLNSNILKADDGYIDTDKDSKTNNALTPGTSILSETNNYDKVRQLYDKKK